MVERFRVSDLVVRRLSSELLQYGSSLRSFSASSSVSSSATCQSQPPAAAAAGCWVYGASSSGTCSRYDDMTSPTRHQLDVKQTAFTLRQMRDGKSNMERAYTTGAWLCAVYSVIVTWTGIILKVYNFFDNSSQSYEASSVV